MLVTINLIILAPYACAQRVNYAQNRMSKFYAHFYLKRQITINDHDLVTL